MTITWDYGSTWDDTTQWDAGSTPTPSPSPTPSSPTTTTTTSTVPTVTDATNELYAALQPIANYGAGDESLGYPLLRWLDGPGQLIERLNDLALDDPTTGDPGWSIIFDPTRCPTYALPWLAQCVGVRFDSTQNTDATQRAAIVAEPAFKRGTPSAIQAAAAKYLSSGQQVILFERDTDPYHFTVLIRLGALQPATYAQMEATYATFSAAEAAFANYDTEAFPQAQVQAALAAAKPAGLTMTVSIATGLTYEEAEATYATYTAAQAAFSSFAQIEAS